jgi:5-methylcytosine-specific restriction endonuclease McrA
MRRTLVLNADYRPLTIVSWQRAISLVMEERVAQLDFYSDKKIRDGKGRLYPIPAVIALKKYVRRETRHAPFCRKNVFLRDALVCQYCTKQYHAVDLTFDHVIPRSKWTSPGSPTCWENIVTSCRPCNVRKADKTCKESKMYPLKQPVRPPMGELFLGLSPWRDKIPEEWIPYLSSLPMFRGVKTDVKKISTRTEAKS